MEGAVQAFLNHYEEKAKEITTKSNLAFFKASISGKSEDYKLASDLQLQVEKLYTNKNDFNQIKAFLKNDSLKDPILKRQLQILHNNYAKNQFSEELLKEIISLSTKIEEDFATFRVHYNGNDLTDNEVDDILQTSKSSKELEEVYSASKGIGEKVVDNLLQLVRLRNQSAKQLGYTNFFEMSLELSELSSKELDKLFEELDLLIKDEYLSIKLDMDKQLAQYYNIEIDDLMPWHYQQKFLQQAPNEILGNFDKYFTDSDIVDITRKYYNNINLNIDDVIEKSDLFEKEGKYQHAYCTDIDQSGDVRVICNIKPNQKWMATMLHEFGHSVYGKYCSFNLPWLLRDNAHILSTEAIAMLFGRLAFNAQWYQDMFNLSDEEKESLKPDCKKSLKYEQIIFSRWTQVIYRFEKELYANPEQNLNALWWELIEKYQNIKRPSGNLGPDWAAKIHLALYPVYYHNYMLGEILASQLHYYIKDKVLKTDQETSYNGETAVGDYLKNLYFSYGALYPWNELVLKATGEKLSPKYYAKQFVNES